MPLSGDYVTNEGLERLKWGQELYSSALDLSAAGQEAEAEAKTRAALSVFRSAMNWLEDTEFFEEAHAALDEAGAFARSHFPTGCALAFEDGTYWQECPAALAHNRVGLSPGYVVRKARCSTCALDPEDCDHIRGRLYDGQLCLRELVELEILEVSLVARPAQPDARIERLSVDMAELQEFLGEFTIGIRITCDNCLSSCTGVSRPFEQEPQIIHEVASPPQHPKL